MSELERYEIEDAPESEAFRITDDAGAEWALRKIRDAKNNNAVWKSFYQEQLRKVEADNADTVERMTGYLRDYFTRVPHKASKTQESYTLPSGKLVMKQPPVQYVRDEDALVKWLEQSGKGDLVKIVKTADWAALKPLTSVSGGLVIDKEAGEIISGVTAVQLEAAFSVSLGKE